jgi:hypothetical protein
VASPFDTNPQVDYDIRAAQKAGLTEEDIARYVSTRRNYDYDSARKAGLSNDDLIRYNISNVSEAGRMGAFMEEAIPSAITAPAVAYGMAKGFGLGARTGATVGAWAGPYGAAGGFLGGGILGALLGGGIPAGIGMAVTEEVKERTGLGGGQYVPGVQPFAVAGQTTGFITGMGLPGIVRGFAAKIAPTSLGKVLGLKPLGPSVAQAGSDIFLPAGVKPVNLGSAIFINSAATNPGMVNALGKSLKWGEDILSKSRSARITRPGEALATDIGIGTGAGIGGGVMESLDPGNLPLRIVGELIGGLANITSVVKSIGGRAKRMGQGAWRKMRPGEEADTERVVERLSAFVKELDDPKNFRIDTKKIAAQLEADFPPALKVAPTIDQKTGEVIRKGLPEGPPLNIAEATGDQLMTIILGTVMSMKGPTADILKRGVVAQSKLAVKDIGFLLDELSTIDNPQLMQALSNVQEQYFAKGLETSLNVHILKALEQANILANRADRGRRTVAGTKDGEPVFIPGGEFIGDSTAAAKTLIDTIMQASEKGRQIESGLWQSSNINRKEEVPISNILKFWDKETNLALGGSEASKSLYIPYIELWMKEQLAPLEETLRPLREQQDTLQATIDKSVGALERARKRLKKKPGDAYDQIMVNTHSRILNKDGETMRELIDVQSQIAETEAGVTTSLGKILQFRSEMLKQSRVKNATEIGAAQHGFYSKLAEKALDDLGEAKGVSLKSKSALQAARNFSSAYNDVFTRAYGGQILRSTATGADRMTPEKLAQQLITSKGAQSASNLTELEAAMDFIIKKTADPLEKAEFMALKKYDYRGATEIIFRDLLSKGAINPDTNQIKTLVVAKYLRDYKDVFAIPGMKMVEKDLSNARTAQILLNKARRDIGRAGYEIEADATLIPKGTREKPDVPVRGSMPTAIEGKTGEDLDAVRVFLANKENPTTEIIQIRSATNPQESMEGLIGLAKRGAKDLPGDPVEGLKQVVIDAAVESSRRTDGTIDMVKFREFLLNPMTTSNSQSLGRVLVNKGILTDDEINNLTIITDVGDRIERTLSGAADPDQMLKDLLETNSFIASAVARALGASGFGATIKGIIGKIPGLRNLRGQGGLIEAQIGARLAGRYFDMLPYQATERILFEAVKDPKLMAILMRKVNNPADVRDIHKLLRPEWESLIGRTAYIAIGEELASPGWGEEAEAEMRGHPVMTAAKRRAKFRAQERNREMVASAPRPSPPLVTPPGPSAPPLPPMPAAPAAAPAAAPPSPDTRSRYASLFPFDPASEIIRSRQGIASIP